jgi:hypothetical protein
MVRYRSVAISSWYLPSCALLLGVGSSVAEPKPVDKFKQYAIIFLLYFAFLSCECDLKKFAENFY